VGISTKKQTVGGRRAPKHIENLGCVEAANRKPQEGPKRKTKRPKGVSPTFGPAVGYCGYVWSMLGRKEGDKISGRDRGAKKSLRVWIGATNAKREPL